MTYAETARRAALVTRLVSALEQMRVEFCGCGLTQGRAKDAALAEARIALAEARHHQPKDAI